jgi:hypothetical protein
VEIIMFTLGMVAGAGLMFMYKCNCDSDRVNDHVREGTQAHLVRQHLESGKKIDHQYAREHFGIKNLSSTVDKLRKSGVDVKAIKDDSGRFYSL